MKQDKKTVGAKTVDPKLGGSTVGPLQPPLGYKVKAKFFDNMAEFVVFLNGHTITLKKGVVISEDESKRFGTKGKAFYLERI